MPRWFLVLIGGSAVFAAVAALLAASTLSRGRWFVAEYESRGPTRYARVLVNDRTGVVCQLNRDGASPDDQGLGQKPWWMCSRPLKAGEPFLP